MSSTDEPVEENAEAEAEPTISAPPEGHAVADGSVEELDDALLVSNAADASTDLEREAEQRAKAEAEAAKAAAHAERKALRFAIPDLDRALSPVRRLANWTSQAPAARAEQVPFLETVVQRWLTSAQTLKLPQPILESLKTIGETVQGYDEAAVVDRIPMLEAFGQHLTRLDVTLGFPLQDVRIRQPRKPKFAQKPEVEPSTASEDAPPPPKEQDSRRSKRGKTARGQRRERAGGRAKQESAPAPIKPFWNGRPSASIADLPVDDAWVEALINANIQTVNDLLWTAPSDVETVRPIHGAGRDVPEGQIAVGGRVQRRWTVLKPDGSRVAMVRLKGADIMDADFAGRGDALDASGGLEALAPDARVVLVGERCVRGETAGLTGAELCFEHGKSVGLRRYPIAGLSDGVTRGLIGRLLSHVGQLRDPFPGSVLTKQGLEPLKTTVVDLHQGDLERARKRMAFDEALALQVGLAAPRHGREHDRGQQVAVLHGLVSRITQAYDLLLNDQQQAAFEDIKRDLRSRLPMRRVLTGDIGCGRNKVVMLATASVAEGKVQVLHLCADPVSAEQRFLFAAPLLKEGGLVARLVQDAPSKAMRDAISRGEVHVVFGTVDLIERDLSFRRLGLVVAEERGTYGTVGEWLAKRRPPRPHALFVPPIPVGAALTLTAFSDCDISCIEGSDIEEVQVSAVPASSREVVYERAREVVAQSRQVVVMFPMVKGEDALDLRAAVGVVRALEGDALKGCRVGLFHSKMPRDERLRAYSDFMRRRYDVLVATGPVEDAPEVPGVAMVVVEQADRVDALRLQRIRGILRRGRHAGEILLVCGGEDFEVSESRLAPMFSQRDGFALSDEGVAEVGIGTLVVDGSPAMPTLSWLKPHQDREWMWKARRLAQSLLRGDARLRKGWAVDVAGLVATKWSGFYDDEIPNPISPPSEGEAPTAEGGDRKRRRRRRRRR